MGCTTSSTSMKQHNLKLNSEQKEKLSKELEKIIRLANNYLNEHKGEEKLFRLEDYFKHVLDNDVNLSEIEAATLFQIMTYAEIIDQNYTKVLFEYQKRLNEQINQSNFVSDNPWCILETNEPTCDLKTELKLIQNRWPIYLNQRLKNGQLVRLPGCSCFNIRISRVPLMIYKGWKRMPKYQEIQNELVTERISDFPTFFVSHRWEAPDNPDPRCLDITHHATYIKGIANSLIMFSQILKSQGDDWLYDVLRKLRVCPIHVNYWFLAFISCFKRLISLKKTPKNIAIMYYLWYDYTCLPQAPRTEDENILFRDSLDNLQEIQGNMITHCVGNLDYFSRLWCYVEYLNSDLMIGEKGAIIQDKEKHERFVSWITDCDETGAPKMLNKLTITNGSDRKPILKMMKRSITFKTQVMKNLIFMCGMDVKKIKTHQKVMDYYEMDLNEMIKEVMF